MVDYLAPPPAQPGAPTDFLAPRPAGQQMDLRAPAVPTGPLATGGTLGGVPLSEVLRITGTAPGALTQAPATPIDMEAAQARRDEELARLRPGYFAALAQGPTLGFADEIGGIAGGLGQVLTGGDWQEGYDANRDAMNADLAYTAEHDPAGAVALEIMGGLPLMAVPGMAVARGGTLGAQVGRGALVGAGTGAASGFGHAEQGERLAGAADGALFGGTIGAAVPAVARGVGTAASIAFPAGRATRAFSTALERSGRTADDVARDLRRNPNLMPLDVDPNLLILAQGVAAQPGRGRGILSDALTERAAGRADRTGGFFDDAMGPTPDVQATFAQMQATTRQNADLAYGTALNGARPANVSTAVAMIDRLVPTGTTRPLTATETELVRWRDMLTGGGNSMVTDPRRLHEMQSQLRQLAHDLGQSATGGDRNLSRYLYRIRDEIVGAIDNASPQPGAYRAAHAQYADDIAVREAFDEGWDRIIGNSRTAEARPEFFREWVNGLSAAELEAARLAARARIDSELGSVRNAGVTGTGITDVEFNVERLRILFGDAEATRLAQLLSAERSMAQSATSVLGNSQTEMRRQAAEEVSVRRVGGGVGLPAAGSSMAGLMFALGQPMAALGSLAATGAGMGMRQLGRLSDQARNAEVARMLSPTGQNAQEVMRRLAQPRLGSMYPLAAAQTAGLSAGTQAQQLSPLPPVGPMLGRLLQ